MLDQKEQDEGGSDISARVDALMKGSIDLHIHSGPSVMSMRRQFLVASAVLTWRLPHWAGRWKRRASGLLPPLLVN